MSEYRRIENGGVMYYGKHLILTAKQCNTNLLDIPTVTKFITTLADKIDMVRFGDPVCERFGGGIETGLSAVQLIETSAIVIHTNDHHKDMYLDVFSCKTFSDETILDLVNQTFAPANTNYQVLLR